MGYAESRTKENFIQSSKNQYILVACRALFLAALRITGLNVSLRFKGSAGLEALADEASLPCSCFVLHLSFS